MRPAREALLLASVALAAACGPPREPAPPALKKAVLLSKNAPACAKLIPIEWPASWPVPTGRARGREFRVFFYPITVVQGRPLGLGAPRGAAVVGLDGKVSECRLLPEQARTLSERRWPESAERLGVARFERRSDALFAATERVAALYAAAAPLSPEEARAVREYAALFQSLAEPALLGDYRALEPAFWDWVVKAGDGAP